MPSKVNAEMKKLENDVNTSSVMKKIDKHISDLKDKLVTIEEYGAEAYAEGNEAVVNKYADLVVYIQGNIDQLTVVKADVMCQKISGNVTGILGTTIGSITKVGQLMTGTQNPRKLKKFTDTMIRSVTRNKRMQEEITEALDVSSAVTMSSTDSQKAQAIALFKNRAAEKRSFTDAEVQLSKEVDNEKNMSSV